jgi:hypothetical protein
LVCRNIMHRTSFSRHAKECPDLKPKPLSKWFSTPALEATVNSKPAKSPPAANEDLSGNLDIGGTDRFIEDWLELIQKLTDSLHQIRIPSSIFAGYLIPILCYIIWYQFDAT